MSNIGRPTKEIGALLGAADAIEDVLAHSKIGEVLTEPARRHALRALRELAAVQALWYVDAEGLEGAPREPGRLRAFVEGLGEFRGDAEDDAIRIIGWQRSAREAWEGRAIQAEAALASAPGALAALECSRCGLELVFSSRQRGDGLCGVCSRAANGTSTKADRVHLALDEARGIAAAVESSSGSGLEVDAETVAILKAKLGPRVCATCGRGPDNTVVYRCVQDLVLCDGCVERAELAAKGRAHDAIVHRGPRREADDWRCTCVSTCLGLAADSVLTCRGLEKPAPLTAPPSKDGPWSEIGRMVCGCKLQPNTDEDLCERHRPKVAS